MITFAIFVLGLLIGGAFGVVGMGALSMIRDDTHVDG